MVEIFAKWPSERGQPAKVGSSEGAKGMEFLVAVHVCLGWKVLTGPEIPLNSFPAIVA